MSSNSGLAIMIWGVSLNVLGAQVHHLENDDGNIYAVETVWCSEEDSGLCSQTEGVSST